MKLSTRVYVQEKYDSASVVVAPGGWCCSTCCWCHCHVSNVMAGSGDEEL
jgi:streptolysin S family bacteriocin protoxin